MTFKLPRLRLSLKVKAILWVAIVPALFMGGMLYTNHQMDKAEYQRLLFDRMTVQAELLAHTIGQSMWDMNTDHIHSVLKQAIGTPDIEKIIVRDDKGSIVDSIWTRDWTGTHSVITHPITFDFAGEERRLGQFELYVSHSSMDKTVMQRTEFWTSLVTLAILVQLAVFSALLNWLLNPIHAITQTMRRLSEGEHGIAIPSQNRRDEIGQMAKAIETFRNTALRVDALSQEIEERRRLQEELERARNSAEEASQAKSQFLATMSHEIRTPLNGVLATAELLSDTPVNERQKKYIGIIRNSGELLLSLLNDILDLAKIEAGKIELHPEICNIRQAFSDSCNLFVAQAENKGLRFSAQIDPGVPTYAITDLLRVRQVMANLVSNAVKYTERGQVDVALTVQPRLGQPTLYFSVTDTGRGIPQESLQLVFDKFTQIHRDAKIGGTGLGLPICQSLIELLGGEIGVSSEVGKGSTFFFWIPLAEVSEADAQTVAQLEVSEGSHEGCKVLLAEDVEINQFVITEMLQSLGCDVRIAENGQVAVEKANLNNFNIIFMDCNMPVMNGYDATRRLRDLGQTDIPVVAVTAHALADERDKCLAAGMNDFISKPVRKRDLARMLDQWVKPSELQALPARDPLIRPGEGVATATPEPQPPAFDPEPIQAWLARPAPEKALRMIELTLKDSARLASEIEAAIAAQDAAGLADSAHALKSVSAQIGALGLSAICKEMEMAGKAEQLDGTPDMFARFTPAYASAVQEICKLRDSRPV